MRVLLGACVVLASTHRVGITSPRPGLSYRAWAEAEHRRAALVLDCVEPGGRWPRVLQESGADPHRWIIDGLRVGE